MVLGIIVGAVARNLLIRRGDYRGMECDLVREAVSADLDAERSPVDADTVEAHLTGCASCRAWVSAAHRVTRHVRMGPVEVVPDHTERIVSAVLADRAARAAGGRMSLARIGLVALAVAQAAVFALALVFDGRLQSLHLSHEVDTFDLALAAGFLTAARRPSRASGMLALVGVAAAGLLATAVLDLADGGTDLLDESPHLLAIVGWLLLYRLARARRDGPYGPSAQSAELATEHPNSFGAAPGRRFGDDTAQVSRADTNPPAARNPAA